MLLKGTRWKNENLKVWFEIQRFSMVTDEKVEARANALNLTDRYLRQNFKSIEVYHGEKLIFEHEFSGEASPEIRQTASHLVSPPPVKKRSKHNPRPKEKEAFKPLVRNPPKAEVPEEYIPKPKEFKTKPIVDIPQLGVNTTDDEPVMDTGDIHLAEIAEAVSKAPPKKTIKIKKNVGGAPRKKTTVKVKRPPTKKSSAKKTVSRKPKEEDDGS